VVLKKAVGRVRGLTSPGADRAISSFARGQERREAILNKSLGMQARAKPDNNLTSRSSSKLAQLRQESKVASKWSKGTQNTVSKISHISNTHISGFGAAVAQAGCNNGKITASRPKIVGNQAQVDLQGGKRMTLPATASTKSVGMFSSLQKEDHGKKNVSDKISSKHGGKRKR
jgi:hypothetical protein